MGWSVWIFLSLIGVSSAATITVNNTKVHDVSPDIYSLFFETEINYGSEGGLYAELIANRDFETLGRGRIPRSLLEFDYKSTDENMLPKLAAVQLQLASSTTYIRHCNYQLYAGELGSPSEDFHWNMVPALNGQQGYTSFQSPNFPTMYLIPISGLEANRLGIGVPPNNNAASFRVVPGLSNPSLQSFQHTSGGYIAVNHRLEGACSSGYRAPTSDVILDPSPAPQDATWRSSAPPDLDPNEPPAIATDFRPWTATSPAVTMSIDMSSAPFSSNPNTLHVVSTAAGAGIRNPGYWGINVRQGMSYNVTFYARGGGPQRSVTVRLANGGVELAKASVFVSAANWNSYQVELRATGNAPQGVFELLLDQSGQLWFDHISMFPEDAVGGLFRKDVFDKIKAMRPGFIRSPGGNYLEGNGQRSRWNWKNTVGPRQQRAGHYNTAWGYWVTDGVGLYELLLLSELIGTASQLSIYTGYSMGRPYVPLNQSQVFADDALDLIEFANGGTGTKWGQSRASMGHSAPFGLKRIEVGNEESLMGPEDYPGHYKLITQAVWKVYPTMYVVASGRWGPSTNGHPCLTGQRCDAWDDHYYRTPDQMAAMTTQYDNYDRKLPDVFVGEWAANVGGKQTLQAAIAESAFMLGFEANADKVKSSSFAPLLRNVDGTQWAYDLINFDSSRVYALPSYDAQVMLRNARGDYTVRATFAGLTKATATVDTAAGMLYIKAVNYGGTASSVSITVGGFRTVASTATVTTLTSAEGPNAENSLATPHHVQPTETTVSVSGGVLSVPLPAWSLVVVAVRAS